jgi:hypothetical protein
MIRLAQEKPKYSIETELPLDWADEGKWRSFHLYAHGDTLQELIDNAVISEIDQDGGEITSYGLLDRFVDQEAVEKANEAIISEFNKCE